MTHHVEFYKRDPSDSPHSSSSQSPQYKQRMFQNRMRLRKVPTGTELPTIEESYIEGNSGILYNQEEANYGSANVGEVKGQASFKSISSAHNIIGGTS